MNRPATEEHVTDQVLPARKYITDLSEVPAPNQVVTVIQHARYMYLLNDTAGFGTVFECRLRRSELPKTIAGIRQLASDLDSEPVRIPHGRMDHRDLVMYRMPNAVVFNNPSDIDPEPEQMSISIQAAPLLADGLQEIVDGHSWESRYCMPEAAVTDLATALLAPR